MTDAEIKDELARVEGLQREIGKELDRLGKEKTPEAIVEMLRLIQERRSLDVEHYHLRLKLTKVKA